MKVETEHHYMDSGDFEIRSSVDGDSIGQISGYALKFNKPSNATGAFIEYIDPNALNGVDLSKALALYDHNYANVLGRVDAGTLDLTVDDIGLRFVIDLPNTTLGRDVYANVKAGNLKSMSFTFKIAKGGDAWKNGEKPIRIIKQVALFNEISVVSVPAYEDTSVMVTRSLEHFLSSKREEQYFEKVKAFLGGSNE